MIGKLPVLYVRNSSLNDYQRCPRLFEHKHINGQPGEESWAMSFGTAVHSWLEWYWAFNDEYIVLDPSWPYYMVELMAQYRDNYAAIDEQYTPVKTEFEVLVCNETTGGIPIKATFDGIVQDSEGKYVLVEHKTTGRKFEGNIYMEGKTLDSQTAIYCLLAAELGYPIDRVLFDYIRRPMLRQKRSESVEQFNERVCESINASYFHRFEVRYTPEQLREAFDDVLSTACDIQISNRVGYYRKHTRACTDYNKLCEFHNQCKGQ